MVELPKLEFSELVLISEAQPENAPGIYFYEDYTEEIIYIGKTSNLRKRYLQHQKANDIRGAVYYCDSTVYDMADADIYETYYINKYFPKLNKAKLFRKGNGRKRREHTIDDALEGLLPKVPILKLVSAKDLLES